MVGVSVLSPTVARGKVTAVLQDIPTSNLISNSQKNKGEPFDISDGKKRHH
jgi:hypothetical protein